ncbi:MAG: hypothetical protein JWM10_118 [Myxococcaceae bacterium]|nr:hypothetical protein [Myxococcaceae bacterium]
MRKLLAVGLVSFVVSAVALSGVSQPRRPPRGPRRPVAAAPAEPPVSPRIAQELGTLRWGINHEQVLEYFRATIRASYAPRMRNLGQVEQYRMVEQRDAEVRAVERTYVEFDGATPHRRWDTSFIGEEYTHNNHEAMLVYEDNRGNREFFFFINDRLWKRVQARNTAGARINLDDFSSQLETIFGPGRRVMDGPRLRTVEWRDDTTRLHVVDATTFYNAFCLIYEEAATVAQLPTLRRNVTPRVTRTAVAATNSVPETGNTTGDANADIVDRITGKIRRVQNADAGAAASATIRPAGAAAPADAGRAAPPIDQDPLGGLGF